MPNLTPPTDVPPTPPPDPITALRLEVLALQQMMRRMETRLVRLMQRHGLDKQGTRLQPEEFPG